MKNDKKNTIKWQNDESIAYMVHQLSILHEKLTDIVELINKCFSLKVVFLLSETRYLGV